MPHTATDWRAIENDKEKYAAYLCSREWGVLTQAVHNRAGGRCERCEVLEIDAVHHLTYARKYDENLEDLQGLCNSCHEYTHGKSEFDPISCLPWLRYLKLCCKCEATPISLGGMMDWRFGADDNERVWLAILQHIFDLEAVVRIAESEPSAREVAVEMALEKIMSVVPHGLFRWIESGCPRVSHFWYDHTRKLIGV